MINMKAILLAVAVTLIAAPASATDWWMTTGNVGSPLGACSHETRDDGDDPGEVMARAGPVMFRNIPEPPTHWVSSDATSIVRFKLYPGGPDVVFAYARTPEGCEAVRSGKVPLNKPESTVKAADPAGWWATFAGPGDMTKFTPCELQPPSVVFPAEDMRAGIAAWPTLAKPPFLQELKTSAYGPGAELQFVRATFKNGNVNLWAFASTRDECEAIRSGKLKLPDERE